MKKMMLTLAIAISSLCSFASEENVAPNVLDAFRNEFRTAKEVSWTTGTTYYKAAFTYNNKHVFAYYSFDGDLMALTRYLSSDDLPMALLNNLHKNYSQYWISDLFEIAKPDGTQYYVTLEDADSKIVLKSSGNTWSVHKKEKKA
jgi:uncharacterized protein YaeQ